MIKPILYYVYDPMCSWCWGYRESWLKLVNRLDGEVTIRYQLGGLAPDSSIEMPISLQQNLQVIWRNIHEQLGTEFNFDFWTLCSPMRSTYPACRACLIARADNKESDMLFAIQQAYYLQAKNPSLNETLIELAGQVGLDKQCFEAQLSDEALNQALFEEITQCRQLPINGFPSLVLALGDELVPIDVNYLDWQKTYKEIIGTIS